MSLIRNKLVTSRDKTKITDGTSLISFLFAKSRRKWRNSHLRTLQFFKTKVPLIAFVKPSAQMGNNKYFFLHLGLLGHSMKLGTNLKRASSLGIVHLLARRPCWKAVRPPETENRETCHVNIKPVNFLNTLKTPCTTGVICDILTVAIS